MRSTMFALLAAAGIGLAGTSAGVAAPANGIAIDRAANALPLAETVHCRPYRHAHRHGWSRGCGSSLHIGPRRHRHHHRHRGHREHRR
jgi:hypothetical protein